MARAEAPAGRLRTRAYTEVIVVLPWAAHPDAGDGGKPAGAGAKPLAARRSCSAEATGAWLGAGAGSGTGAGTSSSGAGGGLTPACPGAGGGVSGAGTGASRMCRGTNWMTGATSTSTAGSGAGWVGNSGAGSGAGALAACSGSGRRVPAVNSSVRHSPSHSGTCCTAQLPAFTLATRVHLPAGKHPGRLPGTGLQGPPGPLPSHQQLPAGRHCSLKEVDLPPAPLHSVGGRVAGCRKRAGDMAWMVRCLPGELYSDMRNYDVLHSTTPVDCTCVQHCSQLLGSPFSDPLGLLAAVA